MIDIEDTIRAFDLYLAKLNLSFSGVAVGGAALNLLGIVTRLTKDCDILDPDIPDALLKHAAAFAAAQRQIGKTIGDDWFNNGPKSLKRTLPKGWEMRLQALFNGKALKLLTLHRTDLLKTKLFAYCDRDVDREDCMALRPTEKELDEAFEWVKDQDANSQWASHVTAQFGRLKKELGYAVRS